MRKGFMVMHNVKGQLAEPVRCFAQIAPGSIYSGRQDGNGPVIWTGTVQFFGSFEASQRKSVGTGLGAAGSDHSTGTLEAMTFGPLVDQQDKHPEQVMLDALKEQYPEAVAVDEKGKEIA